MSDNLLIRVDCEKQKRVKEKKLNNMHPHSEHLFLHSLALFFMKLSGDKKTQGQVTQLPMIRGALHAKQKRIRIHAYIGTLGVS